MRKYPPGKCIEYIRENPLKSQKTTTKFKFEKKLPRVECCVHVVCGLRFSVHIL